LLEVEFTTLDGNTLAVATVRNNQLRPVSHRKRVKPEIGPGGHVKLRPRRIGDAFRCLTRE
jgi:hypothetical protein